MYQAGNLSDASTQSPVYSQLAQPRDDLDDTTPRYNGESHLERENDRKHIPLGQPSIEYVMNILNLEVEGRRQCEIRYRRLLDMVLTSSRNQPSEGVSDVQSRKRRQAKGE